MRAARNDGGHEVLKRISRREWLGSVGIMLAAGDTLSATVSSPVVADRGSGRPDVIRTPAAEFEILSSGQVRAYLLRGGARFTLDAAESASVPAGAEVVADGFHVPESAFVPTAVKTSETAGKLGARGKRVEITSHTEGRPFLEKTAVVEVYGEFPEVAVVSSTYRNAGTEEIRLEQVHAARRRLSASAANASSSPWAMYSFHGSSEEWGRDDVVEVARGFSRSNLMGAATARGVGGGVPVVAFWTAEAGQAIGHIETRPFTCSFPVSTDENSVNASLLVQPAVVLKPGGVFSTPRTFIAVYSGDFYAPLQLYSRMLQRQGWKLPKPSEEAYSASWCGWGYEADVTPAQMVGTMPKLRELGIHWATLDDRWFDAYGDWEPREDTFPGDAIHKMLEAFHDQGIFVQIWWRALAVEDGTGRYNRFESRVSRLATEHPDWLILNKDGTHARMSRNLAVLCPAVPEVQEYHRKVAAKFVREWNFDGNKLDNAFTVPPCYNPRHHHRTPDASVAAVGDVYRAIYETTRAIKPQSVTQICGCGTPPNYAWLPYLDQAVTADPVGSRQVRLRIKMLKALLGPEAAVYGDHVELTEIQFRGDEEIDLGRDFASTVGTGGVAGTKFVWPDPGRFQEAVLTPEKEAHWKKWLRLYNDKMLSLGAFLNLYTTGYDTPEGYAVEKEGVMFYGFFGPWKGPVELRGLKTVPYRITDYVEGRDLGIVHGPIGRIEVAFDKHLLLEARISN
jgi:alpha-galactosidase